MHLEPIAIRISINSTIIVFLSFDAILVKESNIQKFIFFFTYLEHRRDVETEGKILRNITKITLNMITIFLF